MFCTKCGNQIPDGAARCPNCNAELQSNEVIKVESHLVEAILTTLFCCMPFGIVSIVFASKVSGLVASGNIAAAQNASRQAHKWAMIALILGIIQDLCWFFGNILSNM